MPQLQGRESLPGQVPVQERVPIPRLALVLVQESVRVPVPRQALVSVLVPGQAPVRGLVRVPVPRQAPVPVRGQAPVSALVSAPAPESVRVLVPGQALVSVLVPGQAPELMRGQAPVSALMRVLEWVWVPVQAWIRQQVRVPVREQAPVLGLARQPWWRSLPAREQELLPLPMPQAQRWSRVLLRSLEKWLPQWVRLGFRGQRSGRGLHPPKVR